jgi:hypothetical protein
VGVDVGIAGTGRLTNDLRVDGLVDGHRDWYGHGDVWIRQRRECDW